MRPDQKFLIGLPGAKGFADPDRIEVLWEDKK
jgi:hypothetical protein